MKKAINKTISEYLTKHGSEVEKIEGFSMLIENFFETMDEEYHDVKEAFYDEVENYTDEIDEEMVNAIINNLRKKDGTYMGQKWSMEEVESVCKQYDVRHKVEALHKHYEPLKFWLAMNYVFAVHNSPNRTINGYVDLAIDEMTNKNICFEDLIKKIFKKI